MKKGLAAALSVGVGASIGAYLFKKFGKRKNVNTNKYWYYYETLNRWLELKNNGHSLDEFFLKNNYKEIAIYGIGHIGIRLYEELKNSSIKVLYGIDGGIGLLNDEIEICSPEGEFKPVDVIVVTALHAYKDIEQNLLKKTNIKVISLEEVVTSIDVY